MLKVLFTTPILEHPAAGGPTLRVENSIKALSRICELYIVSRVPKFSIGGQAAESFYKGLCREFLYAPSARISANRYVRKLQQLRQKVSLKSDWEYILDVIDTHKIEVLWCGYGSISFELIAQLKIVRPDLKIVFDTDSVWSRFVLRELPFVKDPGRRLKIETGGRRVETAERIAVNSCEITTAVSEVDAEYYRGIASEPGRVMIFSNVIDVDTYKDVPPAPADFKKPCIYLAGTFGHAHSPMDLAARWMLDEVLPLVKKVIPGIHFYMVGRGSEAVWGNYKDPSVTITGKLPSVLPYLCHADVAVVPLQFESGTRFKILEAGACGIPLVSTTLGAEGLPVVNGRDILIADTPEAFADAIIKLIQDKALARGLSANCKELVRKEYGLEVLVKQAEEILRKLAAS